MGKSKTRTERSPVVEPPTSLEYSTLQVPGSQDDVEERPKPMVERRADPQDAEAVGDDHSPPATNPDADEGPVESEVVPDRRAEDSASPEEQSIPQAQPSATEAEPEIQKPVKSVKIGSSSKGLLSLLFRSLLFAAVAFTLLGLVQTRQQTNPSSGPEETPTVATLSPSGPDASSVDAPPPAVLVQPSE